MDLVSIKTCGKCSREKTKFFKKLCFLIIMPDLFTELIQFVKEEQPSKEALNLYKNKLCKIRGVAEVPNDIQILLHAPEEDMLLLKKNLLTKPVRSLSGVSVVALMTKPFACPHGACTMCPTMVAKGVPMSYTGLEPSTRRGIRNAFDSYLMTMSRLEQYGACGHPFDKIEVIIQGGTFTSMPPAYQDGFIRDAIAAMNDFSRIFLHEDGGLNLEAFKKFFELPGSLYDESRVGRIKERLCALKQSRAVTSTLGEELLTNDLQSRIKCVGLTIETRADWARLPHAHRMLEQGCTRLEIGVQSVFDDVLALIKRGHTVKDNVESIRTLRDLGFKLNFHYMPGLPSVNHEQDLAGLKELFSNPDYRPDMLKLYPCMVVKDSALYADYAAGRFKPLSTEEAADMISDFKPFVEPYCRIMRVQRDIPTNATEAGVDRTNLRQYVAEKMKAKGLRCSCIRCKEIGRTKDYSPPSIKVRSYDASCGKEYFISAENDHSLFGFVRLRFPSHYGLRPEIIPGSALIRELHVYGQAVRIGKPGEPDGGQHHGLGKQLMQRVEEIAQENGMKKIVVISGVGVRGYYRKLGYELEGVYMVKTFKKNV